MKTFRLSMLHRASTFDPAAIDAAYDWVKAQMTAADLATCDEVTAKRVFGDTEINVSLITSPSPAPAPPPPAPEEPAPEEPEADTVIE